MRFLGLLPFVFVATKVAAELAEPVASALEADDVCAGPADCEVSLRQLRGSVVKLDLGSSQVIASHHMSGGSVSDSCNNQGLIMWFPFFKSDAWKLYSSFTASSPSAEAWQSKSVVLSVSSENTALWSKKVDLQQPVSLHFGLDFTPGVGTSLVIRGLTDKNTGGCKLAVPNCFGKAHCYANDTLQWAAPDSVVVLPASGAVSVDVTSILDRSVGSVQVFAVPNEIPEDSSWETPEIKLTSWCFYNPGADGLNQSNKSTFPWCWQVWSWGDDYPLRT